MWGFVAGLSLDAWAEQYVRLKARMHGWRVEPDGEGFRLVKKDGVTRVLVMESLSSSIPEDALVITLNTRENEQLLLTLLPRLRNVRLIFTNPRTGKFWTVNSRFLQGLADHSLQDLTVFRGDVEYVS